MGPTLVTTTHASRQKNTVGTIGVRTKQRRKARKNCGKSAARAHPSKSVAVGDGRRKCPVEDQALRIWALGSFCTDGPTGFINTLL
jgi:hypothetical protein